MELKFEKIKASTEFETITEFKLLNYDELPFKFISQTNLYKGDDYYRPNTEGAPIYITDTAEASILYNYRGEEEIRPVVCLVIHNYIDISDYEDTYPEFEDNREYKEIKFDPFTGEEIKISVVSERDITDELNKLDKEAEALEKELRNINYDRVEEIRNRLYEIETERSKLFE